MSRRTEAKQKVQDVVETVEVLCDLCGAKARAPGMFGDWPLGDWSYQSYEIEATAVQLRDGHQFPGDQFTGEILSVDVCPTCFREKLIPWLESQGAEPRREDV